MRVWAIFLLSNLLNSSLWRRSLQLPSCSVYAIRYLTFSPVTFVVNAYDDGKSTGHIREHLNCLGPSDPAKLVAMLAEKGMVPAISQVLRKRLPTEGTAEQLQQLLRESVVVPGLHSFIMKELQ